MLKFFLFSFFVIVSVLILWQMKSGKMVILSMSCVKSWILLFFLSSGSWLLQNAHDVQYEQLHFNSVILSDKWIILFHFLFFQKEVYFVGQSIWIIVAKYWLFFVAIKISKGTHQWRLIYNPIIHLERTNHKREI